MNANHRASATGYARWTIVLVAALPLEGCPTPTLDHGVARSADLDSMPPLDCIRKVIASTPGVADVQSQSLPQVQQYNFRYKGTEGSHISAELRLLWKADGTVNFFHSLMDFHSPPQVDIDATRPVMSRIEHELASQCGMISLPSKIRETCRGVECAPL